MINWKASITLLSLAAAPVFVGASFVQEVLFVINNLTQSVKTDVEMMAPASATFQQTNNINNYNINPLPSNRSNVITVINQGAIAQSYINQKMPDGNPHSFFMRIFPGVSSWDCTIGYTHTGRSKVDTDGITAIQASSGNCRYISCNRQTTCINNVPFEIYRITVNSTTNGSLGNCTAAMTPDEIQQICRAD